MIDPKDMLGDGNENQPQQIRYNNKITEFKAVIRESYDIRFNELLRRPEIRWDKNSNYVKMSDEDYDEIRWELSEMGYNLATIPNIASITKTKIIPRYHPFRDYFNNLPNINSTHHIDKLCGSLKLVNDEYRLKTNALLKKWLISACASALGYNTNQVCLVLIGEQGRYKTTWLNSLCPQKLHSYLFTGHIEPSLTQSETPNLLAENFIINIDDQLTSIFGRDYNALKSIISIPELKNRKAYARDPVERRRIANFCASVNETNFLTDTDNRRYFCIEVDRCEVQSPEFIDMVWAEIYAIVKSKKVPLYFTSDENKIIAEINANYTEITLEADLLNKYFSPVKTNDTYVYAKNLTHGEILLHLQFKAGNVRINSYALTRALKRYGYERKVSRDAQTKTPRYGYDCYEFLPDTH